MILSQTKKTAFSYLKDFRTPTIILLSIIGFGVCMNSVAPIIYGSIVDNMISKDFSKFKILLMIYAAMVLIIAFFSALEDYFTQLLASRVFRKNQQKIFREIMKKRLPDLEKIEMGRLMSYLSGDLSVIIQYDIEVSTTVVFILLNFFVPLIFIFFINVKMATTAVIFAPISVIIYAIFKKKKQTVHKALLSMEDKHGSYTINSILNISAIKAYRIELPISNRYNELTESLRKIEKQSNKIDSEIHLLNSVASTSFQILFLFIACILILNNEITMGIFISFGMYVTRLFSSIDMVQKLQLSEQPVRNSLERLQKLLGALSEDYGIENEHDKNQKIERIEIRKVSFSYENTEKVLSSVSLTISTNGFYSLVGENGSGKSTLFKLLMKFYDVSSGLIYLNEKNYSQYNISTIRGHITYVQKAPFVINDTILENVRLYSNLNEGKINKICSSVGLSSFIKDLPGGLQTNLSEGMLSSGQLQKLSFARALAHPADIFLFDEITSDLDGASENQLIRIMKELGKTKIVLSISHRINAVSQSDRIFVLKDGNILSEGNFEELRDSCKEFSKMFTGVSG